VLEAPTSSFFWVSGGQLRTAPLDDHVLDSITRRRIVELLDVAEDSYTLDDLRGADEAFLASTIREVQAVSAVDDIEIATGGPVTAAAAKALSERIEAELGASPAAAARP
jgi:branched-chain amino acid aminotransferase